MISSSLLYLRCIREFTVLNIYFLNASTLNCIHLNKYNIIFGITLNKYSSPYIVWHNVGMIKNEKLSQSRIYNGCTKSKEIWPCGVLKSTWNWLGFSNSCYGTSDISIACLPVSASEMYREWSRVHCNWFQLIIFMTLRDVTL